MDKNNLSFSLPPKGYGQIAAQAHIRVVWGGARWCSGGSQASIAISILDRPALHVALLDSVLGYEYAYVSRLNKSKSLWAASLDPFSCCILARSLGYKSICALDSGIIQLCVLATSSTCNQNQNVQIRKWNWYTLKSPLLVSHFFFPPSTSSFSPFSAWPALLLLLAIWAD